MPLRYLLDANILSEATKPIPDPAVLARLHGDDTAMFATAAPVWHELDFGRQRLAAGKQRRALDAALDVMSRGIEILPYDAKAARWHAEQRARLERRGLTPTLVDGQIAAVAAVNQLILVTRNVRDFARFSGLRVESWFTSR